MVGEWEDQQQHKFNSNLAASLFPSIVQLTDAVALPNPSNEDPEGRAGKLEVGRQATQLRSALNNLKIQAQNMPAGDLSVDDQQWLLAKLEAELQRKKLELKGLANVVPSSSPSDQDALMQTD